MHFKPNRINIFKIIVNHMKGVKNKLLKFNKRTPCENFQKKKRIKLPAEVRRFGTIPFTGTKNFGY